MILYCYHHPFAQTKADHPSFDPDDPCVAGGWQKNTEDGELYWVWTYASGMQRSIWAIEFLLIQTWSPGKSQKELETSMEKLVEKIFPMYGCSVPDHDKLMIECSKMVPDW